MTEGTINKVNLNEQWEDLFVKVTIDVNHVLTCSIWTNIVFIGVILWGGFIPMQAHLTMCPRFFCQNSWIPSAYKSGSAYEIIFPVPRNITAIVGCTKWLPKLSTASSPSPLLAVTLQLLSSPSCPRFFLNIQQEVVAPDPLCSSNLVSQHYNYNWCYHVKTRSHCASCIADANHC